LPLIFGWSRKANKAKKEVKKMELKRLYLSEFKYHDGEKDITMNIVDICTVKNEIAVAITDEGKISVRSFDLKIEDGRFFFEYGRMLDMIAVDDFEHPEN